MDSSLYLQLLPKGEGKEKANETYEEKQDIVLASGGDLELEPVAHRGKGNEQVMKEEIEVKLDVAEDIDNGEMEHGEDTRSRIEYYACRSLVKRAKDKCDLYRVHSSLRDGSDKHYKPVLVSIGPYHYHGNNPALKDMEKQKVHFMEVLLERVKENSIDRYVDALKNEEGEIQALHCYRDTHRMDVRSFGKCMVRDGFFLIELFQGTWRLDRRNYMLLNRRWMMPLLIRDMLLFENQIPLFVLRVLFALTNQTHNEHDLVMLFATPGENDHVNQFALTDTDRDFVELALDFFELPNLNLKTTQLDRIPHLLGLVYEALIVSKRKALKLETPKQQNGGWKSLLEFFMRNIWSPSVTIMKALWSPFVRVMTALMPKTPEQSNNRPKSWESIWTAVAHEQVGVQFQSAKDHEPFYDIRFSDGVLSIPPLLIDDGTESYFRNLVAYEQYSKHHNLQQVRNYLLVMDCLINSSKDVELLRHCGIIDSGLGDDEMVSTMFNHLVSGVRYDPEMFLYAKMFNEVNKFCKKRRNVWVAKLKNEYFGSPWALVSFLAALLLLLLTILQTVYSLLSYYQP